MLGYGMTVLCKGLVEDNNSQDEGNQGSNIGIDITS